MTAPHGAAVPGETPARNDSTICWCVCHLEGQDPDIPCEHCEGWHSDEEEK